MPERIIINLSDLKRFAKSREEFIMKRKQAWTLYQKEDETAIEELCSQYRRFLDAGKTERECVKEAVRLAKQRGYKELSKCEKIEPGDKVYALHKKKMAVFFQVGRDLQSRETPRGFRIIGAHVDSPRLDVKQIPLYEEAKLVYLDTHYYGGIKKYQWLSLPLALHGVVVRKDGTKVTVQIGEKDEDPVLVISDLLPHLGKEIQEKKVKEFVDAEKLDVLIGNRAEDRGTAKEYIRQILLDNYQIHEEDFLSAELEIVPAGSSRDCGLDNSMIIGYGQDDRSCAYAALEALFGLENEILEKTCCCILADKEEVGSRGATGMHSRFFEYTVANLLEKSYVCSNPQKEKTEREEEGSIHKKFRGILQNSKMLSADVSAAYDPLYETYYERKNAAYLSEGVVFSKYSGSQGKSGGNDACAEYMAKLRRIMDEAGVIYQTAELGAVDRGGGGTIAFILAEYGMDVIDCGPAVLGMHAPWEVISKADLYETVKAYRAFYRDA